MGRPLAIGFLAMLGTVALVGFFTTRNPLALFAGLILLVMSGLLVRKPRRPG